MEEQAAHNKQTEFLINCLVSCTFETNNDRTGLVHRILNLLADRWFQVNQCQIFWAVNDQHFMTITS
jgi:hypothetical protein